MADYETRPAFDENGVNLADPHDTLGHKTTYISKVQALALHRHVGAGTGRALDVGCGYGRMCNTLADLGYAVIGVDPSMRLLKIAANENPEHRWVVGSMPNLPFDDESFDLVCLFNVVTRPLHLMGFADICASLPRLVKPGGQLIVIENIRNHDDRYLPTSWFDETFCRNGLRQKNRIPIRAGRGIMIYLIRYGLIPTRWFAAIANWELRRMAGKKRPPRFSYHNYLFIYERK